jgi:hypothetical protein
MHNKKLYVEVKWSAQIEGFSQDFKDNIWNKVYGTLMTWMLFF